MSSDLPNEPGGEGGPKAERINLQCLAMKDKTVVLDFGGVRLSWIKFGPREARSIAIGLLNAADQAENPPAEPSPIHLPPGPFPRR